MSGFWLGSWQIPKPGPDDYDLKVDGQAEKFLDLKQKLTYFLITASVAPIGFVLSYIKDETSNLAGKWLWLVVGGVVGLLAAGFALGCLHFEIGSYRKHIKYRYLRKNWDDVPKREQDEWDRDNRRAAGFLKYSFLALFVEIAVLVAFLMLLLHSKATTNPKPSPPTVVQMFDAGGGLPAFVEGSSTEFESKVTERLCQIRQTLQDHRASTAIVIGGSDRRELSRAVTLLSASNAGLAQQRADRVAGLLQDEHLCTAAPVKYVTALLRGPRHTDLRSYKRKADLELALAEDRRVEVRGLELKETVAPATVSAAK